MSKIEDIMQDLRNGKRARRMAWGHHPAYIRFWNEAKIFVTFNSHGEIYHSSPMEYILGQDDFEVMKDDE